MKILVFSLDVSLLDPASSASRRLAGYGLVADAYHVIVPAKTPATVRLSDGVVVWGTGGEGKIVQLRNLFALARVLLRGVHYNVLSVQDPYYMGLVGLLLARWYRVPLEIQVHGFEKNTLSRRLLARLVLSFANGIRTVSKRLKKQLASEYRLQPGKISAVPVYTPTDSLSGLQRKDHQGFVFLTASRLVPVKNIELQIDAFADLVADNPNARLRIVGDGPDREKLEVRVKEHGLAGCVQFVGWVSDLAQEFAAADAFLLTSCSEGWGMVVIEAAAAGLPIVMTDVGCAGEAITHNQNGLVVPVGDKEALLEAMRRLVADPGLGVRLGQEAAVSVRHLPSYRETLYRYLTAWQKVARP
ncbi:MAG TPA: glycosyltransferase [Candidatus Paceibacterota bacterium]|nr:glycosyltransferase [Candidatus Paceibacterota bacterium]